MLIDITRLNSKALCKVIFAFLQGISLFLSTFVLYRCDIFRNSVLKEPAANVSLWVENHCRFLCEHTHKGFAANCMLPWLYCSLLPCKPLSAHIWRQNSLRARFCASGFQSITSRRISHGHAFFYLIVFMKWETSSWQNSPKFHGLILECLVTRLLCYKVNDNPHSVRRCQAQVSQAYAQV